MQHVNASLKHNWWQKFVHGIADVCYVDDVINEDADVASSISLFASKCACAHTSEMHYSTIKSLTTAMGSSERNVFH